MVQIKWAPQAKNDLLDIFDYIAQGSKFYAIHTVKSLKARTVVLKDFPLIGKIVLEYDHNDVRELIEGNYRIIYFIENEKLIHILGVIHQARDLTNIYFEKP